MVVSFSRFVLFSHSERVHIFTLEVLNLILQIVFGFSECTVRVFLSHNKNQWVQIIQMRYHNTAFKCTYTEISIIQKPILLTASVAFSSSVLFCWTVLCSMLSDNTG